MNWPPAEQMVQHLAEMALKQRSNKNLRVLVYWDNPFLFIFNPIRFRDTEYLLKEYDYGDRFIKMIIGKEY
jgi:hypothetical protein|tara:strand:+ start:328 stop:540 length:213 start_codon:yes stop_codon:yes gene_type:complete